MTLLIDYFQIEKDVFKKDTITYLMLVLKGIINTFFKTIFANNKNINSSIFFEQFLLDFQVGYRLKVLFLSLQ
jgi:hypothetical protein